MGAESSDEPYQHKMENLETNDEDPSLRKCAKKCPEGTLKVYNIKSEILCAETCINPNLYRLYTWS